jgi:very-short-patch-repair endonuclease
VANEGERHVRVARSTESWIERLVDYTRRNPLAYFQSSERRTMLRFSPEDGADQQAVQRLLVGEAVRLSALIPGEPARQRALTRARILRARARENFEERGLQTLFILQGLATWDVARGEDRPSVPVLLRPLELSPRGRDLDLKLTGDAQTNPMLARLLDRTHRVTLDEALLQRALDEDDGATEDTGGAVADGAAGGFALARVTRRLLQLAGGVDGLRVDEGIFVANCSYQKLSMVQDLERATDALAASDLIAGLAGDPAAAQALADRQRPLADSDGEVAPADREFLVLDADRSQREVIGAVLHRADVVVEGPPGTGKSQTIANLIATMAAEGRTVLFVAEKRAAIDAVLAYLAKVELEELVFDLHETTRRRGRRIAEDLHQALERVGTIPALTVDMDRQLRDLEQVRRELTTRVQALHAKRPPWDVSVYDVQVALLALPPSARSHLRLHGQALHALDAHTFQKAEDGLARYVQLGGLGRAALTSWASALQRGTILDERQVQEAGAALDDTRAALPTALLALDQLAAEVGLGAFATLGDGLSFAWLLRAVARTLEAAGSDGVYRAPLDELLDDLAPAEHGGWPWLHLLTSRRYRRARRRARALLRTPPAIDVDLVGFLRAAPQERAEWDKRAVGTVPWVMSEFPQAQHALKQLQHPLKALCRWLGGRELLEQPPARVGEALDRLDADRDVLRRLPQLCRLRDGLVRAGLQPLLTDLAARDPSQTEVVSALRHLWYRSILDEVLVQEPHLDGSGGSGYHHLASQYRQLDEQHIRLNRQRVRRRWAERVHAMRAHFPDQAAAVAKEARRRRGHRPLRTLFQEAPNVLTALCPCWAMSPLLVSEMLPAAPCFDVVIFDEASQVDPADAIPALLRGRRAVVAGDSKQLPPTPFFLAREQEDDETDLQSDDDVTKDMESILDAMSALLDQPGGVRTLGWHYRSKDERLIAFSNRHIYNESLTTFPGAAAADCLRQVLVPLRPEDSGQHDSRADEVREVVRLVVEHARTRPSETLGVITMGIKHADRIEHELQAARERHPELNGFFDEGRESPFFVKNLERVQGDERDAVILSIGYGKADDGRMQYRFGPLNLDGGERRLNVAITRARRRMTVVSSFGADDMDPRRLTAKAMRLLPDYLRYAARGGASGPETRRSTAPELNPFERDVKERLEAVRIPLVPQFGESGYRIDFAPHRARPGRMVLAIECDGASYHSGYATRDRDRLRQQHLELLGWRFHRIWSTDWFHAPDREVTRALEAYEEAMRLADQRDRMADDRQPTASNGRPDGVVAPTVAADRPAPRRRGPRPDVRPGGGIDDYPLKQLVALVRWIRSDTLLRDDQQILDEVMRELGFQRRGHRIKERVDQAIRLAGPSVNDQE